MRNKLIFIHSLVACHKQNLGDVQSRAAMERMTAPFAVNCLKNRAIEKEWKPCQRAHTCRKNKIIDGASTKVRESSSDDVVRRRPTQALIQRSNWLKERLTRAACFAPQT